MRNPDADGIAVTRTGCDALGRTAWLSAGVACALIGGLSSAWAEPAVRPAAEAALPPAVRQFLTRHCQDCHSGDQPQGKLRLDRLAGDFDASEPRERWQAARQRVAKGEMPPKEQPRPAPDEIRTFTDWVDRSVHAAETARREREGRVALRRLNRVEYENTVRDLLGIQLDLRDLLPPDTSADGFDNNSAALHTSSFLIERYLEAADAALSVAIANTPQPPLVKKRIQLQEERQVKHASEPVFRGLDDALVMFSSSPWSAITVSQFYPPDRGRYRIRMSAYAFQSPEKPVTFFVEAGPMLMGQKNHPVGYYSVPAGEPTVIEFVEHFEARHSLRILPFNTATAFAVKAAGGAEKFDGAGLAVQWIEVEGPLHDAWPPESHRRTFGTLPQASAPIYNRRDRVEVVSQQPAADAERILRDFARRAFRRDVTDADIRPYIDLVAERLSEPQSFEQAVRVGLKAILTSPQFLFLQERPGRLDDYALASRLSYFLWSTLPDAELLSLAAAQRLGEPDVLREQVERLLRSPRAAAFTENFVGQWLKLREIDATSPDRRLYPEFDELLKTSMVQEAQAFFQEVLDHDLSLTNFVASDFAMLNERLAQHYGIPGVAGHELRKVTLPPGSRRGGVLTMAGVLKVTANGTNTSPVFRGAWVLDRILGTPPASPPDGVPAVEPDIRGATTIREQLAKHREIAACAACHQEIDPPGFALESYDVIGGWREHYRSIGRGQAVVVDGRRMPYAHGPRVDPADVLPDGRRFADIDEFKQLLLADPDQLARGLAGKLATYATGRAPDGVDQPELEAVVQRVRGQNYGFRSLVHAIVQCALFRNK